MPRHVAKRAPHGETCAMADAIPLRLFPLPSVALFPESMAPLHVFEARYRQLTEDALADDNIIGLATLRAPAAALAGADEAAADATDAEQESPPLYSVGCAGRIADKRRHRDGRFHLVLAATRRFRIAREIPPDGSCLYRRARCLWLAEAPGDAAQVRRLQREVQTQLRAMAARSGRAEHRRAAAHFAKLDAARLANWLSQSLDISVPEKQSLLEANSVEERLRRLNSALAFLLAQADTKGPQVAAPAPGAGAQTLH